MSTEAKKSMAKEKKEAKRLEKLEKNRQEELRLKAFSFLHSIEDGEVEKVEQGIKDGLLSFAGYIRKDPVTVAAKFGHARLLALMLAEGPQGGDWENINHRALLIACEEGHKDCAVALCEAMGKEMASRADESGDTALLVSVEWGHEECALAVLPYSDPFIFNAEGDIASSLAAKNGDLHLAGLIDRYATSEYEVESMREMLSGGAIPKPKRGSRL